MARSQAGRRSEAFTRLELEAMSRKDRSYSAKAPASASTTSETIPLGSHHVPKHLGLDEIREPIVRHWLAAQSVEAAQEVGQP